jgi:hypothetical protein
MAIDAGNLLVSLLTGSVGAGVVGAIINRRLTAVVEVWRSQRTWKERAVAELLAPIFIQLDRTKRAFDRWDRKNPYLEGEIIRNGNLTIRDLLLSKAHLIPPDLRDDASKLLLHYDVWLEKFERTRISKQKGEVEPEFLFVGPEGYPYPSESDQKFRSTFERYWRELYQNEASGKS